MPYRIFHHVRVSIDLEGTSNLHSSVNELAKIRVMYHNQMLEMENGDIGTLKYLVARYTCEE